MVITLDVRKIYTGLTTPRPVPDF